MSKKIIVEYWGSSRGKCDKEAQDMALEHFEVGGWYEVKEVEND